MRPVRKRLDTPSYVMNAAHFYL